MSEADAPSSAPATKRNFFVRDPSVPYHETRLQKPEVHLRMLEQGAYPDARRALMQLQAKRASDYEYLKPGQEQTPFEFDKVQKEPHWVLMNGEWRLMG